MRLIPNRTVVRGFSLIELATTITILAILIVLGIPSFNEWIHNTKVRNAAEGALNGLQVARSEALRRNGFTQFILAEDTGWRVIAITPPSGGLGGACLETEEIQRRDGGEGSSSVSATVGPAGSTSVTFTPLGWVGSGTSSCGNPITSIDFDSTELPEQRSRELRIVITAGGGIRLCDPNPGLPADDPRAC